MKCLYSFTCLQHLQNFQEGSFPLDNFLVATTAE